MIPFRAYLFVGAVLAFVLLGAWGSYGWTGKEVAEARIVTIRTENDRLRAELSSWQTAVAKATRLESTARAEAAAAIARADAMQTATQGMIERFRAEAEANEPKETPINAPAPVTNCYCGLSAADRERLLREVPVRKPAGSTNPGAR